MKLNEIIYRGFKIVEEEDCYTLYKIGQKKRYDYHKGKVNNPANTPYEDYFPKEAEYFNGRNKLEYICQYINHFIKERKKDPMYEDNVITLLNKGIFLVSKKEAEEIKLLIKEGESKYGKD